MKLRASEVLFFKASLLTFLISNLHLKAKATKSKSRSLFDDVLPPTEYQMTPIYHKFKEINKRICLNPPCRTPMKENKHTPAVNKSLFDDFNKQSRKIVSNPKFLKAKEKNVVKKFFQKPYEDDDPSVSLFDSYKLSTPLNKHTQSKSDFTNRNAFFHEDSRFLKTRTNIKNNNRDLSDNDMTHLIDLIQSKNVKNSLKLPQNNEEFSSFLDKINRNRLEDLKLALNIMTLLEKARYFKYSNHTSNDEDFKEILSTYFSLNELPRSQRHTMKKVLNDLKTSLPHNSEDLDMISRFFITESQLNDLDSLESINPLSLYELPEINQTTTTLPPNPPGSVFPPSPPTSPGIIQTPEIAGSNGAPAPAPPPPPTIGKYNIPNNLQLPLQDFENQDDGIFLSPEQNAIFDQSDSFESSNDWTPIRDSTQSTRKQQNFHYHYHTFTNLDEGKNSKDSRDRKIPFSNQQDSSEVLSNEELSTYTSLEQLSRAPIQNPPNHTNGYKAPVRDPPAPPPKTYRTPVQDPPSPPPKTYGAPVMDPPSPPPTTYGAPVQNPPSPPPTTYGAPVMDPPSPPPTTYGAPVMDPPSPPPTTYGAPVQDPPSPPPKTYGAPVREPPSRPPTNYGAPFRDPSPSFRAPPIMNPSLSYGVPSNPPRTYGAPQTEAVLNTPLEETRIVFFNPNKKKSKGFFKKGKGRNHFNAFTVPASFPVLRQPAVRTPVQSSSNSYGPPPATEPANPPSDRTRIVFLNPVKSKGKGLFKKGKGKEHYEAFSVTFDGNQNSPVFSDSGYGVQRDSFFSQRNALRDEYWRSREKLYQEQQEAFNLQQLSLEIALQEEQRKKMKKRMLKELLDDNGVKGWFRKSALAFGALSLFPLTSTLLGKRKKRDLTALGPTVTEEKMIQYENIFKDSIKAMEAPFLRPKKKI